MRLITISPYSKLFWSVFFGIRTEYGEIRSTSLYWVRMWEIRTRITPNTGTFHAAHSEVIWGSSPDFASNTNAILSDTIQKMKFSTKDFLSECDQIRKIRSFLLLLSHLLKKSLMENFIFCSMGIFFYSSWIHEKTLTTLTGWVFCLVSKAPSNGSKFSRENCEDFKTTTYQGNCWWLISLAHIIMRFTKQNIYYLFQF